MFGATATNSDPSIWIGTEKSDNLDNDVSYLLFFHPFCFLSNSSNPPSAWAWKALECPGRWTMAEGALFFPPWHLILKSLQGKLGFICTATSTCKWHKDSHSGNHDICDMLSTRRGHGSPRLVRILLVHTCPALSVLQPADGRMLVGPRMLSRFCWWTSPSTPPFETLLPRVTSGAIGETMAFVPIFPATGWAFECHQQALHFERPEMGGGTGWIAVERIWYDLSLHLQGV